MNDSGATRLGVLDSSFLDLEDEHVSLHLGAVAIFEGPPPTPDELAERYLSRIDATPRLRQVLRPDWLRLRRPRWEDDASFDIAYHLPRTRLPYPGSEQQLQTVVGRIMSHHLDESRPLWETWTIEGLADDQWALVFKMHHCMVDGLNAMALFAALVDNVFGSTHRAREAAPTVEAPSAAGRFGRVAVWAATHPRQSARTGIDAVGDAARWLSALRPVPRTSLTGSLGGARSFRTATIDGTDLDIVRHAWGGTRNDVVLTMVTRAFRQLLLARDGELKEHSVRCLVPVALSGDARVGNRVSAMFVDLPVGLEDPIDTHDAITAQTRLLKTTHQAEIGEAFLALGEFLPPPLVSAGIRAVVRAPYRPLTTVVTNVPGPRTVQHVLGRKMVAMYPYVPIADKIRIGVAVTSYDGRFHLGVTCDRTSVAEAGLFAHGIEDALQSLVKALD